MRTAPTINGTRWIAAVMPLMTVLWAGCSRLAIVAPGIDADMDTAVSHSGVIQVANGPAITAVPATALTRTAASGRNNTARDDKTSP
jgi:hypothetical protein